MAERFRYDCQNCILLVRRIILDEETFFLKNKDCFYQFGLTAENSLTVHDSFSALLTKLHFLSPEYNFEYLFEQFYFFSSIPRFWIRISTLLAQMFRHSCQNCNLPVQTTIWWKTGLPLKSVTVFTSFFVFRQKNVLENGWNRPARPSDLHSNRAEKRFENNTNFLEEHDIFKWFWDLERKNFRLLTNFFLHCCQNCVLRLLSTNLIMFFRSILNFFIVFEIWKNLFSFVMQNFRRSRQKCFLRVQMTIWWKIGFPLESVTAVSSLLVAKQKMCRTFVGNN